MMRTLVTPPVLAPAALADLKQWLGTTTAQDDVILTGLLHAALDMCESFTGVVPIEATCEEMLALSGCWQALTTRPVLAITAVESIAANGTRTALASSDYAVELNADGSGRVLVMIPGIATRIAVRFAAGLSPSWEMLPEALRHGILRLAAHQHRERESSGAAPLPPAAVAALWRPWRRMRLA